MCEAKSILLLISMILLKASFFCNNQAHTENKVGHHSKIKSQGPCEK